jgi:hypothetical protein
MVFYAVKVGTDPESADPKYRDMAGHTTWGVWTDKEQVEAIAAAVRLDWETSVTDQAQFRYGKPFAEVVEIREPSSQAVHRWETFPEAIAANWYVAAEDLEDDDG